MQRTRLGKAEKYFLTCDKAPAYYLCVALDPRVKMDWFHESWDQYPDTKALWVPEVQRLMLQVWDQEYRKIESTAPRAVQVEVLPSSDKTFGMFPRARSVKHGDCEDPIPMKQGVEFDTIQYWLRRRVTQPQLAKVSYTRSHCLLLLT
ncbi:hypothetical protein E4U23_001927 [Claviceps purpurea]|nr:hypothetical protein E4U23_001927 [Claviceps purpurea]